MPGGGMCSLPGMSAFCHAGASIAAAAAGSVIDQMAQAFQDGEAKAVALVMTFWAQLPTPVLDAQHGPVAFLQADTQWFVGFLGVLGLLIAAGQMAWQRRGEPARQAAAGLFTLAVVTGCAVTAVSLATQAGDLYSTWIIKQALGNADFNGWVMNMARLQSFSSTPGLLIILAIFAIVSCLLQVVLMLARAAMLGLLTGLLPLAAAITTAPEGRSWFRRMLAWLLAFVLYKPVAATIYAFSFRAMGTPNSNIDQMAGIVMIILAVLALPALMRFVAPMVSPVTGGGGAGSVAAATGAAALGARLIPSYAGGGRSSPPAALGPRGSQLAGSGSGPTSPPLDSHGGPGRTPQGAKGARTGSGSAESGSTAASGASGAAGAAGPAAAAASAGIQAAKGAQATAKKVIGEGD